MGIIALRYQGSGLRSSSLQDKYFAYCPISPALCLKKKNNNNGSLSKTKIWVQEIHLLILRCHCCLNLFCCWSKRIAVWGAGGGDYARTIKDSSTCDHLCVYDAYLVFLSPSPCQSTRSHDSLWPLPHAPAPPAPDLTVSSAASPSSVRETHLPQPPCNLLPGGHLETRRLETEVEGSQAAQRLASWML